MASVRYRKRADGTVAWQVLYRASDRQRAITYDTADEAKRAKQLIDDLGVDEALAILEGAHRTAGAPTLAKWCEQYLDAKSGVTAGTREAYGARLSRQLGTIATIPVDMLTYSRMTRWIRELEDAGLGQASVNGARFIVSGALEAAVREGIIASNPIRGVRVAKSERRAPTFLTSEEFITLLKHVRPDARDLVITLVGTGMRFGEASALQVRDIDLNARQVDVVRAWKAAAYSKAQLGAPKSGRSRRTIWIDATVAGALKRAIAGKGRNEFVFLTPSGQPWRRNSFHDNVWQPAVACANGEAPKWRASGSEGSARPWLRPAPEGERLTKRPRVHDLRHTCASWMLQDGVSLPRVQRHLGHSSIRITADTYGHLLPEHMAETASSIGRHLAGIG